VPEKIFHLSSCRARIGFFSLSGFWSAAGAGLAPSAGASVATTLVFVAASIVSIPRFTWFGCTPGSENTATRFFVYIRSY
jgi:hypothetical protein